VSGTFLLQYPLHKEMKEATSRILMQFVSSTLRSRTSLAAENLFLRKQLALYRERQVNPRRANETKDATTPITGVFECNFPH
jgi:hypothetical protein